MYKERESGEDALHGILERYLDLVYISEEILSLLSVIFPSLTRQSYAMRLSLLSNSQPLDWIPPFFSQPCNQGLSGFSRFDNMWTMDGLMFNRFIYLSIHAFEMGEK